MQVFIITDEIGHTYGVFYMEELARQKIEDIYESGYFGPLQVCEDKLFPLEA